MKIRSQLQDFSDIRGQEVAVQAALIAVAGDHNLLILGNPGSGKTMIGRRVQFIIPFSEVERQESMSYFGMRGYNTNDSNFLKYPPTRAPHHTISKQGMLGSQKVSTGKVYLGETTVAHNGCLFLDELPNFRKPVIEGLTIPLKEKEIVFKAGDEIQKFPTNFLLVAAMDPCPCGGTRISMSCTCSDAQIKRYRDRINPIIDFFDLAVEMKSSYFKDIANHPKGEESKSLLEQVMIARNKQEKRGQNDLNGRMKGQELVEYCTLPEEAKKILAAFLGKNPIPSNQIDSILRVARTIADLQNEDEISCLSIAESIKYSLRENFFKI